LGCDVCFADVGRYRDFRRVSNVSAARPLASKAIAPGSGAVETMLAWNPSAAVKSAIVLELESDRASHIGEGLRLIDVG
ncbi:MAG TPA: hypothetical protein VGY56_18825, partial [Verrucomicrobiae bacterium]|nr:hypothetical protein [Verrucomicrobiae bacterium]